MNPLKGVCIGAGYFSAFHYDAWQRIEGVNISALCDLDQQKATEKAQQYNISSVYKNAEEMLRQENPYFVDIITPPSTHLELCQMAADIGVPVICQKPLAPSFEEARRLVDYVEQKGIPFMVHENFRFQPWHREIKKLLNQNAIGDQIFNIQCRMRMGDGWGKDAYLGRQPYFREMEKLLIYETGIHFIDTFRFLIGEIDSVYARLKKLNPVITGEDFGWVMFRFQNGADGMLDGNRYNEPNYPNPRYTFGEFYVEGNGGTIRLFPDGKITIQTLGKEEEIHPYAHRDQGFSGDCVFATQQHFLEQLQGKKLFETNGTNYLRSLAVQDAVYQSSAEDTPVQVGQIE